MIDRFVFIPQDVLLLILKDLPPEDLVSLRSVNKLFNSLASKAASFLNPQRYTVPALQVVQFSYDWVEYCEDLNASENDLFNDCVTNKKAGLGILTDQNQKKALILFREKFFKDTRSTLGIPAKREHYYDVNTNRFNLCEAYT